MKNNNTYLIEDFKKIDDSINYLTKQQRGLKTIALELIKQSNKRYSDSKRLLAYGAQYWPMGLGDGMIEEIFRRIGINCGTFLEISTGDGSQSNTTALLSQGWRGWWIEGNAVDCKKIRKRLQTLPELSARLKLIEAYVSPNSIAKLLLTRQAKGYYFWHE